MYTVGHFYGHTLRYKRHPHDNHHHHHRWDADGNAERTEYFSQYTYWCKDRGNTTAGGKVLKKWQHYTFGLVRVDSHVLNKISTLMNY